jgi:hypothetical protein
LFFGKEEHPVQRFYDIGVLVYYLHRIPWQVANFAIKKELYKIHLEIQGNSYFEAKQLRFIMKAKAI